MRLTVRHVTKLAYDPPADRCTLRLRLYPAAFEAQKVKGWKVSVNGAGVPALLTTGFGDRQSIWTSAGAVGEIEVAAEGEIETRDVAGFVKGLREAARPGVYLRETSLTQPGDKIVALAKSVSGASALDRMHALCGAVRDAVEFKLGTEGRSAAQVLKAGEGGAADIAHVFLAAARAMQAPARFVTGYLFTPPENANEASSAEVHAWAEAHVPELGWVGFDAAYRLCPTEHYVRLASGLDSADASPIRGNVVGRAQETAAASVDISEVVAQNLSATQTQSQTQQ